MKKVVTFGEIMVRLAPEGYRRFTQADRLELTFGGGEANVAVSLSHFGVDAAFVSKLPAHEIGQAAVNSLRRYGVDTTHIVRGGQRVGIYYLEKGASAAPQRSFTTGPVLPLRKPSRANLTGPPFLTGQTGFTLRASPRAGRECRRFMLRGCQRGQAAGADRELRFELPEKTVDQRAGRPLYE